MISPQDCYTLSNGVKIPCIGFGTWKLLEDECVNAVKTAIECGYRHIDTATAYRNEKSVALGIRQSGIKREDIFITDKLWNSSKGYEETLKAFKKSLGFMNLEYLDLYLIHWPRSKKHFDDYVELNNSTWKAFETLYKDGYVRAIGVSNFEEHHLVPLMDSASIAPMVNQIELSPQFRQDDVVEFCRSNNILVEAYSPLTRANALESPLLASVANKHNCSPAQICLAWSLKNGYLPLPKSSHRDRIIQNTHIFNITLDDEDEQTLLGLTELGRIVADPDDPPF
ncbi:MAG: aldo/keto reductase [Clostridiales bacterium]|nr:aldo/keto reductase [Clostridiales bacterium]